MAQIIPNPEAPAWVDGRGWEYNYKRLSEYTSGQLRRVNHILATLDYDDIDGSLDGGRLRGGTVGDDKLYSRYLAADTALIKYATINELHTKYLTAEYIEANYIRGNVGDFDELRAWSFEVNRMLGGSVEALELEAIVLNAGTATIHGAAVVGDLYTDRVTIRAGEADDTLQITGGLIRMRDDEGTTRVQIGRDTSGAFSLILRGPNGSVYMDDTGIQPDGIPDGIIVDDMISPDGLSGEVISLPGVDGQRVLLSEAYTSIVGNLGALTEFNSTVFEQTPDHFRMNFLYDDSDGTRHQSHILFNSEGLELGAIGSPVRSVYSPTALTFYNGPFAVAYIDAESSRMYIGDAEVTDSLALATSASDSGHYAVIPENNGGMSLTWIGE